MKYFAAMCLLAAPLAMAVAPTSAEAGFRDHSRRHFVKRTAWNHGKKRVKWVRVCKGSKYSKYSDHRRHH